MNKYTADYRDGTCIVKRPGGETIVHVEATAEAILKGQIRPNKSDAMALAAAFMDLAKKEKGKKPVGCTKNPQCCPQNEGYGCDCSLPAEEGDKA